MRATHGVGHMVLDVFEKFDKEVSLSLVPVPNLTLSLLTPTLNRRP